MALQPSLAFTRLGKGPQTLEIFLDTVCPFSAKMTRHLAKSVVPQLLDSSSALSKSLSIIIRPYPQPWHSMSILTNEAAIGFGLAYNDPSLFWAFWVALMDKQEQFFDVPCKDKSPNQVKDELAIIAGEVLEKSGKVQGPTSQAVAKFREAIAFGEKGNAGTPATADLKYLIKLGRQNAIHVTPSGLFNGIFDSNISSSWQDAEWEKYFTEKKLI